MHASICSCDTLRRRNTRYKILQLVAQHCFVASFSRCFPFFTLRLGSTCRATITLVAGWRKLLRKVERGSTLSKQFWLCCCFLIKLATWRKTNLLVLWQINQSARCISLTCNKCFCCGSSGSCKVKNGTNLMRYAITRWPLSDNHRMTSSKKSRRVEEFPLSPLYLQ